MEPYDHPQTLQEIGDALSLSREGVRQIMVKAIKKIGMGLGFRAVLEIEATTTEEARQEHQRRPVDIVTLIERNNNILRDSEQGMDDWAIGNKYGLGTSRVRQCCQEAKRRRSAS